MAVAMCSACSKNVVLRDGACVLCGHQVVEEKAKKKGLLSTTSETFGNFRRHYRQAKQDRILNEQVIADKSISNDEAIEEAIIRAEERIARKKAGNSVGWVSVIFAIIGIFMMGIVFIPIAAILSISGFFQAMGARNGTGEAISLLGFLLSIVGFFTSPGLMLAVGYMNS